MNAVTILKRSVRVAVASIVGAAVVLVLLLFFFQGRMIYLRPGYNMDPSKLLGSAGETIRYELGGAQQAAYYMPPAGGRHPGTLWVMFGGNAALALDWLDLAEKVRDTSTAFLMIDYPGYGVCGGDPSPRSIREASDAAYAALQARLEQDAAGTSTRTLCVLGHSLGAAAGLEFAARHDARRIVLVSPFTTMMEMARRSVGFPLCLMLRHRFDNPAQLHALAARGDNRPEVTILHGAGDDIVPVEMSRQMAAQHAGWVRYVEIPDTDHNAILFAAEPSIIDAMTTGSEPRQSTAERN